MGISAIIMMVLILGVFWGGFSIMIYRTLSLKNNKD
ncbi:MetS family NSS transporter small subunit [Cytobacillus sp. FJAT-53684]|uniref:MetS family NSS transporter small subunit n=1 Tax=Cytobacillus mangrovibacter TaxID=3299024 RepID=A0ABW6K3J1_9BACI